MRMCKKWKSVSFRILGMIVLMMAFCLPVSAGVQEGSGEYEIYPTPQSVVYGDGTVNLTNKVNVTTGDDIDDYTQTRIDVTLAELNLERSTTTSASNTDLIVGVYGSGDKADEYGKAKGVSASLFDENDAYAVWIQDGDIVILGKNTDAAYYGVTTLKRIFEQLDGMSVRTLAIEDYSDVEFRGFIEGYYGNPWSLEDRIDLMEFGSEIKMNQYVFAPKDDPYHNSKWRELYPDKELETIAKLAQAGNETKCFFVYALHPFMNNAINLSDATYDSEVAVLKEKFLQVISKAGVRQIAILEDDASGESAEHIVKLMNDMNEWLHELKKTYPDLKTDILYCPTCYMSTTDSKLTTVSDGVSDEIHIVVTGGKIWGEVTENFANAFNAGLKTDTNPDGRYPYMWVNWPCNDNTKTSLIMGGQNTILHTGVTGSKYEGIILNPIQESEPSKVGLFTAADYCWKVWKDEAEGDQAWEDAFKYIDHMSAIETDESLALKEIAKHMITQADSQITGKQTAFDESTELGPKLTAFTTKLEAGTVTADDIANIKEEMQTIKDACDLYLDKGTNRRTASQMEPFISCLRDMVEADMNLMDALSANLSGDSSSIWEAYAEAQSLYEQSQTYGFDYYGIGTIYAEAGRKYITPFTQSTLSYVSDLVNEIVNAENLPAKKYSATVSYTSGYSVWSGDDNLTDGDDSTYLWFANTGSVGDYVQLDLGSVKEIGKVRYLVGADGTDKWVNYHLAYSTDGTNWTSLDSVTGTSSGMDTNEVNLRGAKARYVRIVNEAATSSWSKFSGFEVYEFKGDVPEGTMEFTNVADASEWTVEYGTDTFKVLPRNNVTLAPGEYIGMKLDRIHDINSITVTGDGTEKLTLEKSANASEWKTKDETGAARYIRLMNKTNETVTFNLDSFVAYSSEISAIDLLETTVGGASYSEDARALGTTTYWFDGDLSTKAKYCSTPTKGGYVTYDLGQEITLQSLKVYVLDTAIDYPRDAIIQCSMDNENWTDLITIGDGVENSSSDASVHPVESDGGWKHDTIDVAYAYVENANIDNVKARYIRMYFTAAYNSRWVEINEILINGGAYISTINDPTFVTDAALQKGYEPQNLNDSDLTTAFKPDGTENGTLVYNLSDESDVNRINILQSGNSISNAVVSVRTGEDTWVELGTLDRSYNAFYTANLEHVYAVKIQWSDVVPTIYEIITQKAAGDVLEKNLTDVQKDLETANAAAAEAASALSTLDSKVAAAEAKVAAATGTDKVKAEVELQNLYAEQAAAAAEAATKNAAVATAEAAVAKVEANNARYQAEASTDEAEKSTLEAKAAEKDQAAQTKLAEAEAQKAIATQKLAEQKSYEEAATKKQAELDQLLKEASNKTEETNKTPVTTPTTPGKTEATTFTYKNISYKVVSAGKTVAVTGVTTKKLKSATIPSTVKNDGITYKVVSIQAKAFKGCKKLTKVTIGSNVKKIGKEAFAQCTSLKNVNMKKASNITSIGKKAFSKIKSSAKITVPKKKLAKYKKMLKKAGLPKTAVVK